MRRLLFIIAALFTSSLGAQEVAVLSRQNVFGPSQRFMHSITLDCRALAPAPSGEPLSTAGRARVACDSSGFTLKASVNGGPFAAFGGETINLLPLANTWTQRNVFTATVDTPDTTDGTVTVTNTSSANFTAALGAVATGPVSYGIRAIGGASGVFGETPSTDTQSNGGFFVAHSTGDSTTGVSGQVLADSVNSTFGGAFLNTGSHASNYGMTSFAVGGPAGWFLCAGSDTQPTLLVREGFGGSGETVPMIAVDNDSDVHTFAVRANGTIVHNGGALDIVAAGAPSGACVTGSMYRRTDGTAGATFYVCEATVWAAK